MRAMFSFYLNICINRKYIWIRTYGHLSGCLAYIFVYLQPVRVSWNSFLICQTVAGSFPCLVYYTLCVYLFLQR